MVTESTLIYYDMSTAYIVPTATSSVLSVTPTPGMGPDVEEMERNAVAMIFNNADLEQVSHSCNNSKCFISYACIVGAN